jgi:DNA-binding transcriptional LysR family regulator
LLDLAIAAEPVESPLLSWRAIFVEEFWAVCSKSYLAGAAPPETERELLQQRYIVYDDTRPMHEAWWRSVIGRRGATAATLACSIANLDEMLHLTEMGFGVAVLPNYLVSDAVQRGKLLRLAPRKSAPKNPIYLIWRKASIETSRFKVVRDLLLGSEPGQVRRA